MCGLLTFVSANGEAPKHRDGLAEALESIHHRGPDETGVTVVGDDVVFGFKRLSIIDVEHSHQPLSYLDGRYTITFNGEIYNYVELREELIRDHGAEFATEGDTEVIVAAYHYWGPASLDRLRGMFAFVIWDSFDRVAFGARDPYGIKPLYYLENADGVYFASEKKSLLPFIESGVDTVSLAHYLTFQYVPEPASLHIGISRVHAGHSFRYSNGTLDIATYYRPVFRPTPADDPEKLYRKILDELRESVRLHMRSDVPVGAFLSSGIDSTAIVALAREFNPDILTFTAAMQVEGYSELEVAQESAEILGVTNHPIVVTAQMMMDALPRIVWQLDDPVADPALVPLFYVAGKASEHVTVALSGEGSDEFFGGYQIYREPMSLKSVQGLPGPLQRGLRTVAKTIPAGVRGRSFLERGTTPLEERYCGGARIFGDAAKSRLLRHYDPNVRHTDVTAPIYAAAGDLDESTTMQFVDMHTWLRGDILVKADRMSMAHSLEVRVPFLDRPVFDIAASIPLELKLPKRGIETKYALRQALRDVVPPAIVNRKKLGFPTPIRVWLKSDMYEWAMNILTTSGADELLDLGYVRGLLEAHRRGDGDYSREVWTVLVFCLWHSIFIERSLDPGIVRAQSRFAR